MVQLPLLQSCPVDALKRLQSWRTSKNPATFSVITRASSRVSFRPIVFCQVEIAWSRCSSQFRILACSTGVSGTLFRELPGELEVWDLAILAEGRRCVIRVSGGAA